MKKITVHQFKASDGKIFDTEDLCKKHEIYIDWVNNIPEEIKILREFIIDMIFNSIGGQSMATRGYIAEWLEIVAENSVHDNLNFSIKFRINCSTNTHRVAVSKLLLLLSAIDSHDGGGFLSFSLGKNNQDMCIELKITNTNSILNYLKR